MVLLFFLFIALRPTETEYNAWLYNEKSIECLESYLKCVDNQGKTLYFKEQSIKDGFLLFSLNHTIYAYEDEKVAFDSKSIGILKRFIVINN
ncbi:hypothetical protein ACFSYB_19760 [Litchfieldia salsa]